MEKQKERLEALEEMLKYQRLIYKKARVLVRKGVCF